MLNDFCKSPYPNKIPIELENLVEASIHAKLLEAIKRLKDHKTTSGLGMLTNELFNCLSDELNRVVQFDSENQ